jgi:serine/threonine-protein kinase
MPTENTLPYGTDRLTEALAEYERALNEGRPLDRQAFLERYPDLADALQTALGPATRVEDVTRPFGETVKVKTVQTLPQLDGYEILEELGRGGMGVVYKARQKGTEQLVALKMLHPDWLGGLDGDGRQRAIDQFRLEVQSAARLRHPNRVRILHLGEQDGRPFYAMELIEGRTLADQMRRPEGVSKEAALKYLASVAEAVHEAHQHGILHCDLKPHNILIDQRSDEALLADFGLARRDRSEAGSDVGRGESAVTGTLSYLSPEQTHGADHATKASDVYSLGATLYELLTGRPPFQAETPFNLIQRIRRDDPVPPRKHRPDVNPTIEHICLKCLHKEPAERYSSSAELAGALRGYLREVGYARNFTTMGALFMVLAPVILAINLAVYFLIQTHFYEPVIWFVMFLMYPALYTMFLLAPTRTTGHDHYLSRLELWSVWGGKLFAALAISVAIRVEFADDPTRALRLVYPVFAALSGMAVFCMVVKMPRKLYWVPVGCWLTGIAMVFHLKWAPILYGVCSLVGLLLYGYYLRTLGRELS